MGDVLTGGSPWDAVLDGMLAELARGGPRAESYWAQQLAFGPVLVHALGLRYRRRPPSAGETRLLVPCLHLARAALGALPDPPGGDPAAIRLLALRQARAVAWGRRGTLEQRLRRMGVVPQSGASVVPPRMARPYPLLGFSPGERLVG